MIKVEHLAKRYADVYAVNDISFEVHQGEIVGLLGPNGAGKTTTMRILTCYMPATSGSANVAGYDVFRESINVRKQIGYLPENVPLYPEMRVREYLLFRAKLKKLPSRERKSKIDECIEKCSITEVQNQIIGTLSKGYRQRVGLADTLVHDPKILILDEPTIGLDPNQIRQVRQLIKELGAKHTILLSTHILPEVEMLCERVIIINKGKIVAMDTPTNLAIQLRAGNNLVLEVRGNGEKIKNALTNIKSVKKVVWQDKGEISNFTVEAEKGADVREDVFSNIVKNNGIIREMKQASITLEEIFHQITMREQEVTT
ncbi:MAG: ABC transporter [Planctomycetes bacterium RIFCSPHIGHO2_02_FULL_38_41]|nr:MAG: ABC transporter [Planctomycetes bacterium RIFCSPHIGHO2_02_FULL_38_41]OHB97343.1 MAG: ABC transporter [Planctomycetes bacterium RIFCSPLOWO2_12_38_17]